MTLNDGSPIIIRSNHLTAEIAAPGAVYNRTRFDWTGFITQVTLDASHTFCGPEDQDPAVGTGGIGICNEFGIEKAIGYEDALPGQEFPKLGIGLLIRPDANPYNFFRPYEIARRFPIRVEAAPQQVRFIVDPLDCRGYAVRETKIIRVDENFLQIDYLLENTGSRPITTHEYCHNFIAINRQPLGPNYSLRFPYPVRFEEIHETYRGFLPPLLRRITPGFILKNLVKRQLSQDVLQVSGQQIRWKNTPEKSFYARPLGFSQTGQPQWEIIYEPGGVGLREYDSFAPERVAIWGTGSVVSAEIFNPIDLPPGQSQSWTRRFEFFD
jgi:hypothetical protein